MCQRLRLKELRDLERLLTLQQSFPPQALDKLRGAGDDGVPCDGRDPRLAEILRAVASLGPDHLDTLRELAAEEGRKGVVDSCVICCD
jgi:hypothetical protein